MPYTYRFLDDDDKKAVEADIADRDADTTSGGVDAALAAAWEKDHYAHSLLFEAATSAEHRQAHKEAMEVIEEALAVAGR